MVLIHYHAMALTVIDIAVFVFLPSFLSESTYNLAVSKTVYVNLDDEDLTQADIIATIISRSAGKKYRR